MKGSGLFSFQKLPPWRTPLYRWEQLANRAAQLSLDEWKQRVAEIFDEIATGQNLIDEAVFGMTFLLMERRLFELYKRYPAEVNWIKQVWDEFRDDLTETVRAALPRKAGAPIVDPISLVDEGTAIPTESDLEASAAAAILELRKRAAGGSEAAARSLHRIAEDAVTGLNAESDAKPDLFRPVAQRAMGWPGMYSDLPYERKAMLDRVKSLEVGRDAPAKVMLPPAQKSLRYADFETSVIQITQRLDGILPFVKGAAQRLAFDDPDEDTYLRRRDTLLQGWKDGGAIKWILDECRRRDLSDPQSRFQFLWDWIVVEADGKPERIRELRRPEAMKHVGKRSVKSAAAFCRLLEMLGPPRKIANRRTPSAGAVRNHLTEHLSEDAIEKQIRSGIQEAFKECLRAWKMSPS